MYIPYTYLHATVVYIGLKCTKNYGFTFYVFCVLRILMDMLYIGKVRLESSFPHRKLRPWISSHPYAFRIERYLNTRLCIKYVSVSTVLYVLQAFNLKISQYPWQQMPLILLCITYARYVGFYQPLTPLHHQERLYICNTHAYIIRLRAYTWKSTCTGVSTLLRLTLVLLCPGHLRGTHLPEAYIKRYVVIIAFSCL